MSFSSGSSSGEEDGDAQWRAAIDSVASTTAFGGSQTTKPVSNSSSQENQIGQSKSQNIKFYQLKAQQLLDDMLEKSVEVVSSTNQFPDEDSQVYQSGIQLFRHAPRGIVFDHVDEFQGPKKKPRILPGEDIDENSMKFKHQVQSVAIDGTNIIAAAKNALQKSLSKLEARESAAKAAAKREEERVMELKKIRGERWLPCMARERQAKVSQ